MLYSLTPRRAHALILAGGLGAFVSALLAVWTVGPDALSRGLHEWSAGFVAVIAALAFALVASTIIGWLVTRRQGRQLGQCRSAIDSMPQGLCMFDASERLVVCNTQYYEMYKLRSSEVRPGSTLKEVLSRRVARGTFSRDPDEYRTQFLTSVRQGRTMVHGDDSCARARCPVASMGTKHNKSVQLCGPLCPLC